MSFLDSFSSEFRTFKRIPTTGETKNAIGEIEKSEMLPVNIVGILLEKNKMNFIQSLIEKNINYNKTNRVFFYKKNVELNKDDLIEDEYGTQYKVIHKPKKQIVFNAQYDHNTAVLSLIE